jgi:hypothetical protein
VKPTAGYMTFVRFDSERVRPSTWTSSRAEAT